MLEASRDPTWQFIGAFLSFLAIIVSIFLYLIQRHRKSLSYKIISQSPLLIAEEEVSGKIQILFEGKPAQDVYLIVLKIANSGTLPIIGTDYEWPINLSFGQKTQILSVAISETNPKNLKVNAKVEDGKAVLNPILLNSGDSIRLKILVSNFDGQICVDGRIIGVKKIRESKKDKMISFISPYILMMLSLIFICWYSYSQLGFIIWDYLSFTFLPLFLFYTAILVIIYFKRQRKLAKLFD